MNGVRCAAPANIAVTSTKSVPPGRSIGSKYIIRTCVRVWTERLRVLTLRIDKLTTAQHSTQLYLSALRSRPFMREQDEPAYS